MDIFIFQERFPPIFHRIFRRFSLTDLIPLRLVSKKFDHFVLEHCAQQRAVKLLFNENKRKKNKRALVMALSEYNMQWEEQFQDWWKAKDNVLVLPDTGSNQSMANFVNFGESFKKLFPNVKNLVLVRITKFVSVIVPGLFASLSGQLTGLTVVQTTQKEPKKVILKLMTHVNELEELKYLHLFNFEFCPMPKSMPIFAQLEELTLDCYFGDLYEVVKQLGPSLRHFRLGPDAENYAPYYRKLGPQNPKMAARLTHLSLGMGICCSHYVPIIADSFPNITYLDASAYSEFDQPLGPILSDLAKLRHLRVFKIDASVFRNDQKEHNESIGKKIGDYLCTTYTEQTRTAYSKWPTIKELHLYDWEGSLEKFKMYDVLGKVFTNLNKLHVFSIDYKSYQFKDKVEQELRKHLNGGKKLKVDFTRLYWKYMHTNRA